MKKINIILFILVFSFVSLYAQEKKRIVVVADGVGLSDNSILNTFIDDFQEVLLYATDGEYEVRNGQDQFMGLINEEIQLQATGLVSDDQLADIGQRMGAQLICGIVVEKDPHDGDYYFRTKVVEVESARLICTSRYPNELIGDKKVEDLNRYNRQRSSLFLIERLGILPDNKRDELRERIDDIMGKEAEQQFKLDQDNDKQAKRQKRQQSINEVSTFFKPFSSFTFNLGGSSRGFQTGVIFDLMYFTIGGGVYLGDNREFPIASINEKYAISGASPYFMGGINFKYFGFGVKSVFYFLKTDYYVSSPSYTLAYEYEKRRLDSITDAFSETLIGFTPVFRIHVPLHDWKRFSIGDKYTPYAGLSASIGYSLIPKLSYNPGWDFSAGISFFW